VSVFKKGDLVKPWYNVVGMVISDIRKSTPRDNHKLGVFYTDLHYVVDVLIDNKKHVFDIGTITLVSRLGGSQ
jgi:hypothetical protein